MGWGRLWVEQVWRKKIRVQIWELPSLRGLLTRVLKQAFGSSSPEFGNEGCVEDTHFRIIGL